MSVEEEVELRDLVAQTLETNGCLAKIRAELRASIFLALDEDVKVSKQQPLLNNKIKSCLETAEGRTMFRVVREFLEFFNLYFTISVFEPESYIGTAYKYEGREKTARELGLNISESDTVPLLLHLIKIAQTNKKKIDINLNIDTNDIPSNDIDSDSNVKTDSNVSSICKSNSSSNVEAEITDNLKPPDLNATFDINSPVFNFHGSKKIDEKRSIFVENNVEETNQDTSEDTSAITDESAANHADKKVSENSNTEASQTLGKPSEKPKLSEKLKNKSSLSSLSDLPPLQVSNKPHVNDILPSLYNKDKSNLGVFDTEEQYEEDFMYSGDDLSLTSDYLKSGQSKINLLDGIVQKSASDKSSSSKSGRVFSDNKLSFVKPLKSPPKTETNGSGEHSPPISERLEINNSSAASN